MHPVILLCVAIFLLSNVVLGARLLALGARNRAMPEILLAVFFVVGGALGNGLGTSIHWLRIDWGSFQSVLPAAALAAAYVGNAALLGFTWLVFRRNHAWAAALCVLGIVVMAVSFAVQGLTDGFGRGHVVGTAYSVGFTVRCAALVWAAVESLRFYHLTRARVALGLAEPLVARRFLLWGIACSVLAVPFVMHLGIQLVAPRETFSPASVFAICVLGASAAAVTWVAFFPTRRSRARAEVPGA